MASKRASIQLSINFLVTFIITIVVFGMGIILAQQIFSGSEGLAQKTFEDLDKQIGSLVCSGNERVCFSAKQRTIERGAFGVFGLSVQNVFSDANGFNVSIDPGTYVVDQASSDDHPVELGLLPRSRMLMLDAKKSDSMGIGIEVPKDAPSGIYAFTVQVRFDNRVDRLGTYQEPYGGPRKIYVKVP